jgi:hypothetical protein
MTGRLPAGRGLGPRLASAAYATANRPAEAGIEGSRALALATATWSARTLHALGHVDAHLATTRGPTEAAQFRTAFSDAAAANRM